MKSFTSFIATFLIVFSSFSAFASVGTIVDINLENATATAIDMSTKEIVRFEDVDPKVKMKNGCVVDFYNPTEKEAKMGAKPAINEVLECGK